MFSASRIRSDIIAICILCSLSSSQIKYFIILACKRFSFRSMMLFASPMCAIVVFNTMSWFWITCCIVYCLFWSNSNCSFISFSSSVSIVPNNDFASEPIPSSTFVSWWFVNCPYLCDHTSWYVLLFALRFLCYRMPEFDSRYTLPLFFAGISLSGCTLPLMLLSLIWSLPDFSCVVQTSYFFEIYSWVMLKFLNVVWRACFFVYHIGLACPADDQSVIKYLVSYIRFVAVYRFTISFRRGNLVAS